MRSKKLLKGALFLFFAFGILPIGYNLQVFLERQSKQPPLENVSAYGGIIVLGGCMNATLSHLYQVPNINGSCERIIEGISLHRQFPDIPFLYTGGSGNVRNQDYRGADAAHALIERLGIDTKTMIFERDSRNTHENMLFSKNLVTKRNENALDKTWILVTSASHMPRASRVFCHGGWKIIPYPVDHKTDGHYKIKFFSPLYNYTLLKTTAKEIVGILAYGITSKLSLKACESVLK